MLRLRILYPPLCCSYSCARLDLQQFYLNDTIGRIIDSQQVLGPVCERPVPEGPPCFQVLELTTESGRDVVHGLNEEELASIP